MLIWRVLTFDQMKFRFVSFVQANVGSDSGQIQSFRADDECTERHIESLQS